MLEILLLQVTSLATVINPLGAVPVYISLTDSLTVSQQRRVAAKAALAAFVVLTLFALAGQAIFRFFGISVDGLRVVGGVLFFMMGYEMLRGITVPKKLANESDVAFASDIAITPLAIPMISGPGAITMVILFMQDADAWQLKLAVILNIMLVCLLTAAVLIGGRRIISMLGPSGSTVAMRIMGLIVMLIAVEFFFAGVTPYVQRLLQAG